MTENDLSETRRTLQTASNLEATRTTAPRTDHGTTRPREHDAETTVPLRLRWQQQRPAKACGKTCYYLLMTPCWCCCSVGLDTQWCRPDTQTVCLFILYIKCEWKECVSFGCSCRYVNLSESLCSNHMQLTKRAGSIGTGSSLPLKTKRLSCFILLWSSYGQTVSGSSKIEHIQLHFPQLLSCQLTASCYFY